MKFALQNCSSPELRQTLEHAFKVASMALDIDYHAVEVQVKLLPGQATTGMLGPNTYFANAEMGATLSYLIGNVAKMKLFAFNTPQLVQTLCHELTHVAQMLRGDLRATTQGLLVWKGRYYNPPRTQAEYEALPWEVEANVMATRIVRRLG